MISNRRIDNGIISGIKVFFADVDGTLTDGCTYYSAKGEELKKFNHKDGRGNYLLRKNNIKFGIITGEDTDIVLRRSEKINADFCFLGVGDKLSLLKSFCSEYNILLEEIAFIGDDTNDLEIIKNVGLSFAVNDAMPEVKENAHLLCSRKGGDGAFREAVDYILKSSNKVNN
jgi:YrbI family 3-deoxy-D-manno-octulosonate 8-phosphate phosphatase